MGNSVLRSDSSATITSASIWRTVATVSTTAVTVLTRNPKSALINAEVGIGSSATIGAAFSAGRFATVTTTVKTALTRTTSPSALNGLNLSTPTLNSPAPTGSASPKNCSVIYIMTVRTSLMSGVAI